MIGVALNVAGILAGGFIGMARPRPLSASKESFAKSALGALTIYYGLRLTWISLEGPALRMLKQLGIAVLALMLGKLAGQLLRLQKASNRLGRLARDRIAASRPGQASQFSAGFQTCAILFCAAPLGILGSVQDGLSNYFYPLGIKGVMDGLATLGFVTMFGWGALLAALPVLALEGTITLLCSELLGPFFQAHAPACLNSMNAAGGLLVFSVALVILGLKKIELADYLPSLAFAPVITWLWK